LINSILGAAIGSIDVIGLTLYPQDSKVGVKAITGMVATVIANTITASIFGAAAFAQPAMGRLFLAGKCTRFLRQYICGPTLHDSPDITPVVYHWRNIHRDCRRWIRPLAALEEYGLKCLLIVRKQMDFKSSLSRP
jgi:hypothetical protein